MLPSYCARLVGTLALAVLLAAPSTSMGRGPRGGGGRGGFSGGARAGGGAARPAPRSFAPSAGGRPATLNAPPHAGALSGRVPTTRPSGLSRPGAANPAQVQQWLGANASAGAARNGQHAQAAATHFQNTPQPFTPAWYAQHPNAWQATHPYAPAAAAVTAVGVTTWIAGTAYSSAPPPSSTTVVYAEAPPVEVDVTVTEAPAPTPATPPDDPAPAPSDDWLVLGVFDLKPQPGAPAAQVVQLSVDRGGALRGVYYDQITGATQNVTGAVDAATGAVRWSAEASPGVVFSTTLDDLTSGSGSVTVTLPTGAQTWRVERQAAP